MTREEAIKILKRDVGCRRLPTCPDGVKLETCPDGDNLDASCENCEYVTNYGDLTEAMEIAIKVLEEPERKTGKWEYLMGFLWKCSECGGRFDVPYNFCPNCGKEMKRWRGEKE